MLGKVIPNPGEGVNEAFPKHRYLPSREIFHPDPRCYRVLLQILTDKNPMPETIIVKDQPKILCSKRDAEPREI